MGLTSVSADELAKAKTVSKAKVFRDADNDDVLLQGMGTQLLISGRYGSSDEFARAVDSLTEADVTCVAKKLLSSKPTVAAYGDTHSVPHLSAVEALLKGA